MSQKKSPSARPSGLAPVPLAWVPYWGKNSRQEPVWRDCMDKTRLGWSGRQKTQFQTSHFIDDRLSAKSTEEEEAVVP